MFKKNDRYKILTPKGYSAFDGINTVNTNNIIKLETEDGIILECSNNHKIICMNNIMLAINIKVGDHVLTKDGYKKIAKKESINGDFILYDPINVENGNLYYSNDIISHNCDFIGSTNTVLNTTTIETLLTAWKDPEFSDLNDRLRLWKKPEEGNSYVIGVDSGKGTGENWSTIQVMKIISINPVAMEQVAVFEDNLTDVYEFAEIVDRISIYYNNAHIMCENNGEGSPVVQRLWWELENENLVNTGSKVANLGIRATRNTKPKAVLLMKKLIEDGSINLIDRNTIEQLSTFIEDNNKFFGKDRPDDLVSALYWSTYIFEMGVLDESFGFITKVGDDIDLWGVLSDVERVEEDWSWLNNSDVYS